MQSVPITTKAVCSNSAHGNMYSIQHCDQVCLWLAAKNVWFSPGTPVSSTNKTDCHDITEILLKIGVKHHNPNPTLQREFQVDSVL